MNIPTVSDGFARLVPHPLDLADNVQGVISWLAAMFWVTVARYTRKPLLCAGLSILVQLAGTIALKIVPHSNVGGSLAAIYILEMYWVRGGTMWHFCARRG
jgi:hypothetical protein